MSKTDYDSKSCFCLKFKQWHHCCVILSLLPLLPNLYFTEQQISVQGIKKDSLLLVSNSQGSYATPSASSPVPWCPLLQSFTSMVLRLSLQQRRFLVSFITQVLWALLHSALMFFIFFVKFYRLCLEINPSLWLTELSLTNIYPHLSGFDTYLWRFL